MKCAEYRRAVLANPHDPDPALAQHVATCEECRGYTERLLRFEAKLGRALALGAGSAGVESLGGGALPRGRSAQAVPLRSRARRTRGWLAMAASVVAGLVVAGGLWLAVPHRSLAADVVEHMAGEPQAWVRTTVPVPGPALESVLRNTHMRLKPGAGMVSYAQSCLFRGHHVPHLVVQTDMGPVTVMVLVHESASRERPFDEGGYRGVIMPVPGHGSLAVLAKDQSGNLESVERIAAQVEHAIEWTG